MAEINVVLSLGLVGPCEGLHTRERWPFCLRLSAGYSAEPVENEREQWALALRPWVLFAQDGLRACIRTEAGEVQALDLDVTPGDRFPRFTTALQAEVDQRLVRQLATFTFGWAPTTAVQEVAQDHGLVPLPGLLQGLAELHPALSQSLRAAWYFEIPRAWFEQVTATDARFAVAPRSLVDERTAELLTLDPAVVASGISGIERFEYVPQAGGARATASGPFIRLTSFAQTPSAPLATYWLPTFDNRAEPIVDLDTRLRSAVDPLALISTASADALADVSSGLQITASVPVDPLEIATAFLVRAREFWQARTPATPAGVDAALRAAAQDILDELKSAAGDPIVRVRDSLRKKLEAWWAIDWTRSSGATHWAATMLEERAPAELAGVQALKAARPDVIAGMALDTLMPPSTSRPAPVLPNEGIHLLVGPRDTALVHEDAASAANDGDASQVAAVGLLVRRAASPALLATRPWRLVTAGVGVLDPTDELNRRPFGEQGAVEPLEHTPEPLARGLPTAFVDRVQRNEISYRGEHPGAASPLRYVHRDRPGNADFVGEIVRLGSLTYEPAGVLADTFPWIEHTRCPALRYGDAYEFAAFAFDRAGGGPAALSRLVPGVGHGIAVGFDWDALAAARPAEATATVTFGRRVPVGEINTLPENITTGWPAAPAGVAMRSREWLEATVGIPDNAPILLLGDRATFDGVAEAYRFHVEPPRLDEFTLGRWAMPPIGGDPNDAVALQSELIRIFRERDALLARNVTSEEAKQAATSLLPHDPAVSAIGLRITRVDASLRTTTEERTFTIDRPSPFQARPITISAALGAGPAAAAHIAVPSGEFCCLEFFPLVALSDYARFDAAAFDRPDDTDAELIVRDLWTDPGSAGGPTSYRAFKPTRILIEAASPQMPDAAELYRALQLMLDDSGAVRVLLDAGALADLQATEDLRSALAFVDRFTLLRQRWVWRNLPLVDPTDTPPSPNASTQAHDEWRRRMRGGLPSELWDANARDVSARSHRFDVLADINHGLVDRGDFSGRFPRGDGRAPAVTSLLTVDDRDAVAAADYLRFGLIVHSRYAAILEASRGEVRASAAATTSFEPRAQWRRVAAPYRGDRQLKPLRILSILPMTRQPVHAPFGGPSADGPTPFIVVLDESWYRECGHMEGLEAYLTLEPTEIGQSTPNPYRAGPLPDHHVRPAGSPYYHQPAQSETIPPAHPLDVFGPFGYSLDRADSESLANATAFVVYPPADVGPHWWMGVRLRRLLSSPAPSDVELRSEPSDVQHFYTLPGNLVTLPPPDTPEAVRAALILAADGTVVTRDMVLRLTPVPGADRRVLSQYAYLLLIGPTIADGGRGLDVFMPQSGCWLEPGSAITWSALGNRPSAGRVSGRLVELLLNGRYAANPLKTEASMRSLLSKVLPRDEGLPLGDAPAALRRISDAFQVEIQ